MVCAKVGGTPDHCGEQNTARYKRPLYLEDVGVFHHQELPLPTIAPPPLLLTARMCGEAFYCMNVWSFAVPHPSQKTELLNIWSFMLLL